jgi:hypothetical protein
VFLGGPRLITPATSVAVPNWVLATVVLSRIFSFCATLLPLFFSVVPLRPPIVPVVVALVRHPKGWDPFGAAVRRRHGSEPQLSFASSSLRLLLVVVVALHWQTLIDVPADDTITKQMDTPP